MDRNEYAVYLVKLAQGRIHEGVFNEPRVYFDRMALGSDETVVAESQPDVFRNGEQFPVKITHMVAGLDFFRSDGSTLETEEFDLSYVGMELRMRDHYYMNPRPFGLRAWQPGVAVRLPRPLMPAPIWANEATAVSDQFSFGASTWRIVQYGLPFVLSARDTLEVQAEVEGVVASNVRVSVAVTGYGMQSYRPYVLSSEREFQPGEGRITLPTDDFRTDGAEPVVIDSVTGAVTAPEDSAEVTGDTRRLGLNIRQVGNGTNLNWFVGPVPAGGAPSIPLMPCSLMGATAGRAMVHRFPVPLTWEPGEGLDVLAQDFEAEETGGGRRLDVALLGHIMVT